MKTLFNAFYYVFVAAVLVVGIFLLATLMPIPGNFKAKIVKSGSMEPAIPTGGVVVIKPSTSYEVGDVVTFGPDTKTQVPTTHRIVEVRGAGAARVFTTKGDANDSPDPVFVRPSDINGKVLFSLPYMGYILDFARQPLGFALLVGVPALAVIFDEIRKIIKEIALMRRRKSLIHESKDTEQSHTTD